ncbi:MAG: mechanosensitive ion channel domain-containing protein [Marinilabiliaceae bacterium]|jgi:small-conductance mechanosensitive channel|nr:mechanosensitive ion channel domain-containing protein [Marinilabiliaceae bacterium]
MNNIINNETLRIIIASVAFFVLLVIVFFIYRFIFRVLKKKALKSPGKLDDFILDLVKVPGLWFIYWILLGIFSKLFLTETSFYQSLSHVNKLLVIFSLAWVSIKTIKGLAYYLQSRLNTGMPDNLKARKTMTSLRVFKAIAQSIIVVIALSAALLTFEQARTIGISLLTSAGIVGVILGFAAQKSLGLMLAGIQLAITQPIRLDDVVIVEGEWGRIEEITMTYVVVKIWDDRRLVLPVTYFLETPFQNWTRTSANITGTVYIYVDYSFPVESLRKIIPDILKENNNWDGRVFNVQVTKASEHYKELRVLLSSSDASKNWDLRTFVREKIIDYINEKHPDSFARIRLSENISKKEKQV